MWNPNNEPPRWEDSVVNINHAHCPVRYEREMIRRLERLRATTTIYQYNIDFNLLAAKIPAALRIPVYLIHRYTEGLPHQIQSDIALKSGSDLYQIQSAAQNWERNYSTSVGELLKSRRPDRRGCPSSKPQYKRTAPPYARVAAPPVDSYGSRQQSSWARNAYNILAWPEPIDPSAIHAQPVDYREMEDLRSKGLCFYCRTGRHRARDCPVRRDEKNWTYRQ